jgi:uncharacterized protein
VTTQRHPAPPRPGWIELAVGAAVYVVLRYCLAPFLGQSLDESLIAGLVLGAVSGLMGLAAFYAAFAVRLRAHAAFGVRRTSGKWLLLGAVLGLGAVVVTQGVVIVYALLGGDVAAADPQGDYRAASQGGVLMFVLNALFLAVLTPIGEEFAFRGVLVSGLRRYGPWISVPVSAVLFALVHGVNIVLVPAVVVGIITAILFLRSGSVWPGVMTHAVNNGAIVVLALITPAA